MSDAYAKYLAWVSEFLPVDKMARFRSLLTLPIETVDSTESIFDEISKFFDSQDRFIKYEFVNDELEVDFAQYSDKLSDAEFWSGNGFKAMKTKICSFLVVDLPPIQSGPRPEPYYYLLEACSVIDTDVKSDNVCEFIAFKQAKDVYCVFDDEFFRAWRKGANDVDYVMITEAQHSLFDQNGQVVSGIGYCPARTFWSDNIEGGANINKRGPITNVLSKLDWLLFVRTSYKYLELYGGWPIIVSYKEDCDYRDEHGNECNEGYINYEIPGRDGELIPRQKECPACKNKSMLGPGEHWKVDPPQDKDDVDLMENPVKIVDIPSEKLEYWQGRIDNLDNEIYLNCVGFDGNAINDQAINQPQVHANFESKKAVLLRVKGNFEKAHKWSLDTICKLRYAEYFVRSTVDYGTEFFLKTPEEITTEYQAQKSAGLPFYLLSQTREQIDRTKNRNNPDNMQRNEILSNLEPYLDMSMGELAANQMKDIDPVGYMLKLNFNTFIQRFEREQMNIVRFGALITFEKKIEIITQKLLEYAREKADSIPRPNPPGNGGPAV